jgi:hypothetical protein
LVVPSPSRPVVTPLVSGKYERPRADATAKHLARRNPA